MFLSQVADELVAEFVDPNSNLVSPDKVVHSTALDEFAASFRFLYVEYDVLVFNHAATV